MSCNCNGCKHGIYYNIFIAHKGYKEVPEECEKCIIDFKNKTASNFKPWRLKHGIIQ